VAVGGVLIVENGLWILAGVALGYEKADLKAGGHAIECRINAEDPLHNFAPAAGTPPSTRRCARLSG